MGKIKINYQCSNCGKREQTSPMAGVPHGMFYLGYRAVGNALYCPACVASWKERNGAEFYEQYPNASRMFARWWNDTVERLVPKERIRRYKELPNGDYVEL